MYLVLNSNNFVGFGYWVRVFGDWAQSPIPNPQKLHPTPKPQNFILLNTNKPNIITIY